MATLDDKLLGEKLQNYCSSSSEDEDENEEYSKDRGDSDHKEKKSSLKFIPESQLRQPDGSYAGSSTNTGPKGVIKDWQRFKQLEREKNEESQRERVALAKKLAMTCRSDDLDKELVKEKNPKKEQEEIEDDLMQDDFFKQYVKQKFDEMHKKSQNLPRFGKIIELTNDMFLNEIDKEHKDVTIIIHIYDQKMNECKLMNECLDQIARDYQVVKFCKIKSTEINLSEKFRKTGVPALLIYKNGELIGNFVKMAEEFGDEFVASDVENFLLEQNYLPSSDMPSSIRCGNLVKCSSTNDDDELD